MNDKIQVEYFLSEILVNFQVEYFLFDYLNLNPAHAELLIDFGT